MLHKQPPKPMSVGGTSQPQGPMHLDSMPNFGGQRPSQDHGIPPMNPDSGGPSRMEESVRFAGRDPRSRDPRERGDPRGGASRRGGSSDDMPRGIPPHMASTDPDKTRLIMQVLQLTDQQISMLPREQQASIMELKRQINSAPN